MNNTGYFLPTGDLYLLSVLNSSLMWWLNFRYLPHGKDEALRAFTFLVEALPIIKPAVHLKTKIESLAGTLIDLARSFAETRASFMQWLTHETSLAKLPSSLETPWQLRTAEFLAVLKRSGLKHTSPSTVAHLSRTFESEAAALKTNRIEALRLERELDDLIIKAYKLTPDELDLLRRTTPPRSPLTVQAESVKVF